MKIFFIFAAVLATFLSVDGQTVIPLYADGKIPNSKPGKPFDEKAEMSDGILIVSGVTIPTLTVYKPKSPNGTSIIIFPGGGYSILASGHEGSEVALAFNELGITAFVLKYRLPDTRIMIKPDIGPLEDGLRAIQVVRSRADEWALDPKKIGVIGFSAGGHLASTVATMFEKPVIENPDKINLRADFIILGYPVISADKKFSHAGSFAKLLGEHATLRQLHVYSNEFNVTSSTPPTFLFHASDDAAVKPENSIVFYQALVKNHIPAELHIYQGGGHGFGLNNPTTSDKWIDRVANWLKSNGWMQ